MPEVHITIKNLPQIKAAFESAPRLMGQGIKKAVTDSTFLIEGRSKKRTPVLTGFLRSSHRTSFQGSGLGFKGTVEPTAKYAGFVHEGTRFMRARPFLREAVQESELNIESLFVKEIQNVLDRIGRSA